MSANKVFCYVIEEYASDHGYVSKLSSLWFPKLNYETSSHTSSINGMGEGAADVN